LLKKLSLADPREFFYCEQDIFLRKRKRMKIAEVNSGGTPNENKFEE